MIIYYIDIRRAVKNNNILYLYLEDKNENI